MLSYAHARVLFHHVHLRSGCSLDAHPAGKAWMVGDSYTLVDSHLAGAVAWIGGLGFDVRTLKNVAAWSGRGEDRPAVAKVMAG